MHGATSGPGNAGAGPTPEDLDSVLSRFQKWSGTRNGAASKSGSPSNIGRAVPSKKANLAAGARELTYEQALRATSYRRQGYQAPPPAMPMPAAPKAAAQSVHLNSDTAAADRSSSTPPIDASATRQTKIPRNSESRLDRRARTTTTRLAKANAATVGASSAPQSEMPLNIPKAVTGRRKRAGKDEEKFPARIDGRNRAQRPNLSVVVPLDDASIEPAPLRKPTPLRPSGVPPAIAQPAFREVLQQSAGLAPAAKDGATLENKTIALSLRVSDAEQARIQACAARANVSVSAYLRQCALGVEDLRDQVELALSELRKQDMQKATLPGLSAIPRILRQVAAGWFRKLRGNPDYTGISLR